MSSNKEASTEIYLVTVVTTLTDGYGRKQDETRVEFVDASSPESAQESVQADLNWNESIVSVF